MLNIFWSFLAEGNAHSVYRYIGPKSDTFTGMVLKLPKDTTIQNQTRLLRQYRFVKKVVIGSSMFPVDAFQSEDSVSFEKRNRTSASLIDRSVKKPKETVQVIFIFKKNVGGEYITPSLHTVTFMYIIMLFLIFY
jgi:hypothetical protein